MRSLISLPLSLLVVLTACKNDTSAPIGSLSLGQPCSRVSECKPGLDCRDGLCAYFEEEETGPIAGSPCGDGCGPNLCCGNQNVCRPISETFEFGHCGSPLNAPCGLSAECDVGLVCSGDGICVTPGSDGTRGFGESCESIEECQRPLFCGLDDTCQKIPYFPGVSCAKEEEELGAFRMYYEVPGTEPLSEFYRHPFPSDLRFVDGKLDMTGHPTPGEILGVDFTKLYIEALEEDADGFGLTAPIFVRFSDNVDTRTLGANTATASVFLVDLTESVPANRRVPIQIKYRKEKGQVICGNSLGVAPQDGVPLEPSTTYALVILESVRSIRGDKPIQDADFAEVMGTDVPRDTRLVRAQETFAPLRAWLTRAGVPPATVVGATVFTTGNPAKIGSQLRASVRAADTPVIKDIVLCDGSATSPCGGEGRGCLPVSPTHHQLQGRITIPTFQQGERPYREAGADGKNGAFLLDANGVPTQQGTEDLCFGLSIPKAAMPAGGWPVVIYGHGTGGDFTSGLRDLAGQLAAMEDAQGNVVGRAAVLTFDNAMHGPRQGLPVPEDPGPLFFNVRNPRAARDNVLQGAADVFSLVRFVEDTTIPAARSGLAGPVRFDPDRIIYYGHSQGTVIAPPVLAFEPGLRAAVMTGAGAEIGLTVLEKKKPNDVSAFVRIAFGDQNLSRVHPIIGFLTFYFGASDAVPYAPLFAKRPPEGRGPTDLLHVYGVNDGYAPESTQAAWARAAGEPIVGTVLKPLPGVESVQAPLLNNRSGATVGLTQFAPPFDQGVPVFDGHFVGTRDEQAIRTIQRFILDAATGDGPATIRRAAE